MNIIEALQAMKDSKKIRGRKWKNKQIYFELNENGQIVNLHGNLVDIWTNSLTADDWEVYEPIEYFDFFEAIKRLKDGKKVTNEWIKPGYYYYGDTIQYVNCTPPIEYKEYNSKRWFEVE